MEVVAKSYPKRLKVTEKLEQISTLSNKFLASLAGLSLFSMMILIVINSVARKLSSPFLGTVEVVGWLAAFTTAFALGYTQQLKGNVVLDLVMNYFSKKVQWLANLLVAVINVVFFLFVFYQLFMYSLDLKSSGQVSEALMVSYYPLVALFSLGFLGLLFSLLVDLIKACNIGEDR
ncbi:TRAP transporter small permease [Siminovitchia sediminis]|uniref:TRAP transporter small permease n=1 Tax=Siminovitchia sediminis TaxID=1274353 RepID=A0ABW4KM80_9BACI